MCTPGVDALRIAAYEFNYEAFLDIVKEVLDAGVDIRIVYDARQANPKLKNVAAVEASGLDAPNVSSRRTQPKSYISHNKFIVKLRNGRPHSVWTNASRESLQWRDPDDPPKPLRTDDWWVDCFGATPRSTRRRYFARS